MTPLSVGVGQADFTPEPGLPMMGHFRDDYGATGTHDPLCARAMVFDDQRGNAAALLTLDLCMVPRDKVALMRQWIEADTGIPGANVLITCTHTHGGPATMSVYGMPKASDKSLDAFLRRATGAVTRARQNAAAANLRLGKSVEHRLSFNRRLKSKDGKTHMNWEMVPAEQIIGTLGPIDPEVVALACAHNGTLRGVLVNFALHPAVLDYENSLYSADYPGYLAEAMGRIAGGDGLTTMFFNGCCGNVNHLDYADPTAPRRGYPAIQRIGYMLAAAAQDALNSAVPVQGDRLAVSREHVPVERFRIDDATAERCRRLLQNRKPGLPGSTDGLPEEAQAAIWLEMFEEQHLPLELEVMAIRVGDIGIIGLPGEVFCEFGLAIKQGSPAAHTVVIELANDAAGYIPTSEAYTQGGYEPTAGSTRLAPGAGERLVDSALRQLRQLFRV